MGNEIPLRQKKIDETTSLLTLRLDSSSAATAHNSLGNLRSENSIWQYETVIP